jgi:hypothetical protein
MEAIEVNDTLLKAIATNAIVTDLVVITILVMLIAKGTP